jgi:mannan endo-1,6-alpha-mannosidase
VADSIKQAASTIAHDMVSFYTGDSPGDIPGTLPEPYYWWEAGAMFGALIDYWYYTGDSTYNDITTEALLFQVGPLENYLPPNQTKTEGNDDQCFWALSAMAAAEANFQNPRKGRSQWLSVAETVFNSQAARWDTSACGGGLRWQIYPFNKGYDYKNSVTNGCFFNLGARLARYTGNETYAEWADKVWDWMTSTGLINHKHYVFDGIDTKKCEIVNHMQWTYNAGAILLGAANMYNHSNGSDLWGSRTWKLVEGLDVFFKQNVMEEILCEPAHNCDVDQLSFKSHLSRWMGATPKIAPFTFDRIMSYLGPSAVAAAKQCSGGPSGNMCGASWTSESGWDGTTGVGQQMAALEVIQSNLLDQVAGPVTGSTGGTSKGGALSNEKTRTGFISPVLAGDRAGAGILTTVVILMYLGGLWFIIV